MDSGLETRLKSALDKTRSPLAPKSMVKVLPGLPVDAYMHMGLLILRDDFGTSLTDQEIDIGSRWIAPWPKLMVLPGAKLFFGFFFFLATFGALMVLAINGHRVAAGQAFPVLLAIIVLSMAVWQIALVRITRKSCLSALDQAVLTEEDRTLARSLVQHFQESSHSGGWVRRKFWEQCLSMLDVNASSDSCP